MDFTASEEERIARHSSCVYSCSGKAVARDWRYMERVERGERVIVSVLTQESIEGSVGEESR